MLIIIRWKSQLEVHLVYIGQIPGREDQGNLQISENIDNALQEQQYGDHRLHPHLRKLCCCLCVCYCMCFWKPLQMWWVPTLTNWYVQKCSSLRCQIFTISRKCIGLNRDSRVKEFKKYIWPVWFSHLYISYGPEQYLNFCYESIDSFQQGFLWVILTCKKKKNVCNRKVKKQKKLLFDIGPCSLK